MRIRAIVSEAWRNTLAGTSGAVLFGLALAFVVGALACTDARSVIDLQKRADAFAASGASVQALVAKKQTDAVYCEALSRIAGIRASGALRPADPVVLRAMVANAIPAYAVTPGFVALLASGDSARPGVWLPEQLAATLKVKAGGQLVTTAGTLTVAGTYRYPDDGRDSRLAYAVLLPQPVTGTFDECWADVWPSSPSAEGLLYAAVKVDGSDESGEPVNQGQLNPSLGTAFDGAAEFAARPSRLALPACAIVGFVLGFGAVRRRRLELAGALHIGMPKHAILAMTLLETAVWAVAGAFLGGCALVFATSLGNPADALDLFLIDLRGPLAAVFTAVAGAAAAATTVREKHLFRYFKDRN
ncbi:hypothetical protein GCM10027589_03850 [Actinocorallia lasiicapitis]